MRAVLSFTRGIIKTLARTGSKTPSSAGEISTFLFLSSCYTAKCSPDGYGSRKAHIAKKTLRGPNPTSHGARAPWYADDSLIRLIDEVVYNR